MTTDRPNVLVVMTDEERYPPPYEHEALLEFRRAQLPARERMRVAGVEFHRHYTGATACSPSRATLFTGQYPSLHGVTATDGMAKRVNDPGMHWLDPDTVPTLGDWFRAGRVRQVADVFGVPSTAQSVRAVAFRALEHDDEEVRALASRLLVKLERTPGWHRR